MFICIGVSVIDIRAIRAPNDLRRTYFFDFFLFDRYTLLGSKIPTPSKQKKIKKIRPHHTILTSNYQAHLEAGMKKIDIVDFFGIRSQ